MAAQMLGGTTTQTATAARVNLLPPEIAERATLRKAQLAMVGTGLAAVVAVGFLYTSAKGKVSDAQEAKANAAAANVKLASDLAKLQSVREVYAQVDQAHTTLATAMRNEVLWSHYLYDITLTIPENVWLTNFTAKAELEGTAAGANNGAVFDPGMGTVTINGTALGHDDVAAWLESLAKEKGYMNPYFTSSVERLIDGRKVYDFISTVNLDDKARSNRYTKGTAR